MGEIVIGRAKTARHYHVSASESAVPSVRRRSSDTHRPHDAKLTVNAVGKRHALMNAALSPAADVNELAPVEMTATRRILTTYMRSGAETPRSPRPFFMTMRTQSQRARFVLASVASSARTRCSV